MVLWATLVASLLQTFSKDFLMLSEAVEKRPRPHPGDASVCKNDHHGLASKTRLPAN